MSILLSIIIVNWNVAEFLLNAIQSVMDNPPTGEFEVIVVDNASTDDSLKLLYEKFPSVKVIANKINLGFGRANNQGMKIARGEYIFILNPDTIILENALDKLINVIKANPQISMVGPALVKNYDLEPQLGGARLSRTFISGVMLDLIYIERLPILGPWLVKKLRYPYDLENETFVEVISGSAMMFKASTIKQVGYFDERYFLTGEDIELCDRFWEKGFKIYYYPDARIIHFNQSCSPVDPVNVFINKFLGIARYYELKNGKCALFWFRVFTYVILFPKLLIKALFAILRNDQKAKIFHLEILGRLLQWRLVGDSINLY